MKIPFTTQTFLPFKLALKLDVQQSNKKKFHRLIKKLFTKEVGQLTRDNLYNKTMKHFQNE